MRESTTHVGSVLTIFLSSKMVRFYRYYELITSVGVTHFYNTAITQRQKNDSLCNNIKVKLFKRCSDFQVDGNQNSRLNVYKFSCLCMSDYSHMPAVFCF